MTTLKQFKCDICNAILKDNEISQNNFMGMNGGAKSKLRFIFEGFKKEGDLCLNCAIILRDKLEAMKLNR